MNSGWTKAFRICALSVLLVSIGCGDLIDPLGVTDRSVERPRSLDVNNAPTLLFGFFADPRGNDETCLPAAVGAGQTDRVSAAAWIDSRGGELTISGYDEHAASVSHTLTVPAGVVTESTLFCMALVPTNHMKVELTAYRVDANGQPVNVGRAGFSSPVYLTMALANVRLPQSATSRMGIVYEPESGPPEKMQSVPTSLYRHAAAELWHFSKYALALD